MDTMWTLIYAFILVAIVWLIARIIVWQIAQWIKKKFDVDIAIKSIGIFSIKEINVRVNQLQTIEVDKIGLQFKLFNRDKTNRLISLKLGEVRVRSEINQSSPDALFSDQKTNKTSKSSNAPKNQDKVINILSFFFKHMSLHVEMLNIMVLHAFVPDSLLHINLQGIHLASDKNLTSETNSIMACCLTLNSVEGKILKSPKEVGEVTSCIAQVSTSLSIAVLVGHFKPVVELNIVNIDFDKLQIEIHEGALVPGILLPSIKIDNLNAANQTSSTLNMDVIQRRLTTVIAYLPLNFSLCIRSFGVAFFGDETMGETTRGAHVCARKVVITQVKDTLTMVPVVLETVTRSEFKVPNGFIRATFEDVTMTDYYKHKVASMGRTVLETKLTANGVLSNSLDLTAWHVDYIHNESVEFWSIIFKKIEDAERQRVFIQEAVHYFPPHASSSEGSKLRRRARVASAPDPTGNLGHPDILQGTEDATFSETIGGYSPPVFSITQALKTIKINVVFECTIYDASFSGVMTPSNLIVDSTAPPPGIPEIPPSFTIGLDSFTGSVDQSPNSRDFNFMSKMDHFWCMVIQDTEPLQTRRTEEHDSHSSSKCEHDIHRWGRVFNVENLGLYGSACIKAPADTNGCQEISFLIDAKVSGVQIEVSGCAAQALSSVLVTLMPEAVDHCNEPSFRPAYSRQATTPEQYSPLPRPRPNIPDKKYRLKLACLELDLTKLNGFILSSDKSSYADCFVARFDEIKAEITGSDDALNSGDGACVNRTVNVVGVAITTVHNPAFSPFASYDAGINGSLTPASQLPSSLRHQQTKAAQYRCVPAAQMTPSNLSFECLDIGYSTYFDNDIRGADGTLSSNPQDRIRRQLTITLTSDSDIIVRWTPSLHALVHYGLLDFWSLLAPFFKSDIKASKMPETESMHIQPNSNTNKASNHGDHHMINRTNRKPIPVQMFGDGGPRENPIRPLDVDVSISSLILHFCLADKQSLKLCLTPLRCVLANNLTSITFEELAIILDDRLMFTFSNTLVEMAPSNDACVQDRAMFSDLKTVDNRAWSFQFSSVKCFFPHKYDFAATFDLCITTFKWAKGLYRSKSLPFRGPRLPPDLLISIDQFTFEIGDWDFECHLRDNHELMKDEWIESEKRRHVLDQRMTELRRKRGEMLPAKKVEELYCRLEEESTKIYLSRCRDLYGFCAPPVFTMPHHHAAPDFPSHMSKNASFSNPNRQFSCNKLYTWTLTNFRATVLCDETMHGMKNALDTIRSIDKQSPFPFKTDQDNDPDFVTLWCRVICLRASKHQVRLRNFPQCLMDYSDWTIKGKLCAAEQRGPPSAKRTEYVHLPAPWGRAEVLRNMPALKFYHDLTSEVHTFNMAWGPCWEPAWSQVNLAFNLISKSTIDPSPQLPWWDKSRLLFHGRLEMSMGRANLLHLACLDPYNTTEHMHWDWKNLYMLWTSGHFLFKGDLDIHIRNASKYDDIRFLHFPHLKMSCDFEWICLDGADPHNHHQAVPNAPDKIEASELADHDSYLHFRSRNIDLSIDLDTKWKDNKTSDVEPSKQNVDRDKPEILLYSTTLRWLGNFWSAINAVARPICKGALFRNVAPPKLKLSRHYRNVKLSFAFPELKASYWSSYAQQLGIEWLCGEGKVASHFRLHIVPHEGDLIRRSLGQWFVISTTCNLSDTKMYLLKRQEVEEVPHSTSTSSLGAERNFMLSLSLMSYHRSVSDVDAHNSPIKSNWKRSGSTTSRTSVSDYDDVKYRKKRQKKTASPTKKPQNRQTLVVHDLRAMWTTENRDVVYGLYEGYNKAAVLRRNLSTHIMSKFRMGSNGDDSGIVGSQNRKQTQFATTTETGGLGGFGPRAMDPKHMLRQLRSEAENKLVVGTEEPSCVKPKLKGVASCNTDDVVNEKWLIKFVNCQAMLKGPKTQGYIIITAALADFLNRDYKVSWRGGQLTTKSSWVGSLTGTQVFATVGRNVTSSGQDGENVPWLSVSDIAPRGPSPGMLDISDLMGGGQAIGGVVGDGVSAGSFQLQRIVSRCTCHMYYVGYEALVDSEQTDYAHLLPETPRSPEEMQAFRGRIGGSDIMNDDEKSANVLTILQPQLEICTNASQFTMILDIVENLLLYVEPVMREHWERVDRMRFKLRLTSADDALKHRDTLASKQSRIRTQLTNMRQLERQLYRADRALDNDPLNEELREECSELRQRLAEDKETLNLHSEELGIIIRCFKELFLEQKTRNSSLRPQNRHEAAPEEEAAVARTTEVSLGRVKWNLTDEDGQLNLAQFEMKDFLYDKVNRSDDSVSHCFEIAWLAVQNLLPNSFYRDVIKPRHPAGLRNYGVSGAGGQSLTLRVLCRVRPPVGGISVKDHVEVNAAPLSIQLTYHFFRRMMGFFFPDKGTTTSTVEDDASFGGALDVKDNRGATLLGLTSASSTQEHRGSIRSLPSRPPPPSPSAFSTPGTHRRNRSLAKRAVNDADDDVEKMKERAARNNSFLYIKITQVPVCVSYKGEKEKNMADVHEFDVIIPMLEYHSMTWTWHDFAMAVKRDCKKQLVSQLIKKKFHLSERNVTRTTDVASEQVESQETAESQKKKLLLGNTLQRTESTKRSLFRRKK